MIERITLHDKVVRYIGLKILSGKLTTLPNEADLGKELKVSRSILRESIKVLASKGLVEVATTGTHVRPREDWNLLDPSLLEWMSEKGNHQNFFGNLCEFRKAFEPMAAELAAARATPHDIQEIQAAWDGMKLAKTRQAYNAADLRFHQSVLKGCHNELLYQVAGLTKICLRLSFNLTSTANGSFSASLPMHKNVLKAIAKRDSAAARRHMEEIIGNAIIQFNKLHSDGPGRTNIIVKDEPRAQRTNGNPRLPGKMMSEPGDVGEAWVR